MTNLYVYAIVDRASFEALLLIGQDEAPVFALACGDFFLAVSSIDRSSLEPLPAHVWRHEQVLNLLMTDHAVLPLRFGTIARDQTLLLADLLPRQSQLRKDLTRLDGKVEVALRLSGHTLLQTRPQPVEDHALNQGAAYLRARQQSLCGSDALQLSVHSVKIQINTELDAMIVDRVWPSSEPQILPLKASFLIHREDLDAFVQAAERIAARNLGVRVSCTGPWAPYSFVGLSKGQSIA